MNYFYGLNPHWSIATEIADGSIEFEGKSDEDSVEMIFFDF